MNKVYIGHAEVTALVIIMIGAKAVLGYPRMVTEFGLTAGWLIPLFSGFISIGFWLMLIKLLERFPGKSLTEITELTFGPPLGLGLNMMVFFYFLLGTGNLLRLFSDSVILTILTETPISAIAIFFILTAWVAVYYGIEAISRSAYISVPFLVIGVVVVLLVLYPYYDFKQLLPVMGAGILPLLKQSFLGVSSFGEVISLAYLVPYFSFDMAKLKTVGIFSISFTAAFFAAIVIVYLMVLPFPTSTETWLPVYQLSRSIFLGHYLQRVEAIFVIFAAFTAFLRISIGLLITAIILRDTLKLPYVHPLFPALCLLIFSLAFTFTDMMQTVRIEALFSMVYGWTIAFALPFLTWVITLIFRKGERRIK